MMHDKDDKAREMFTIAALDGKTIKGRIDDLLGDEPYVVIGDFAYVLGYDGSIWAAPIKEYSLPTLPGKYITIFYPEWDKAVDLDEASETNFPRNRLGSVISDIGNIRDIMRQMGIKVETDKNTEVPDMPLPPQIRCNCEDSACYGRHPMGGCTVPTSDKSPKMRYLGEVCTDCARRTSDAGGGQYITWPGQTDKQP